MSEKKKGQHWKKAMGAAAIGVAGAAAGGCEWLFRYAFTKEQWKLPHFLDEKIAGNEDMDQYQELVKAAEQELLAKPWEQVEIRSEDRLRLKGRFYPGEEGKKEVFLAVHGYRNRGTKEFALIHSYYDRIGASYLLIDQRACGDSEGEYMTYGVKESEDVIRWANWLINRCGEDCKIYLHGVSMGAATVLITAGKQLPKQIRGVIADCGYTSALDEFTWQLEHLMRIPAKPILRAVNRICKTRAGFDMRDASPLQAVGDSGIPHLFIHGDRDAFVPYEMMERLYQACKAPKTKVTVANALHARSYFVNKKLYEESLDLFLS